MNGRRLISPMTSYYVIVLKIATACIQSQNLFSTSLNHLQMKVPIIVAIRGSSPQTPPHFHHINISHLSFAYHPDISGCKSSLDSNRVC